jgi:REP element-mobilizing transposase RayT
MLAGRVGFAANALARERFPNIGLRRGLAGGICAISNVDGMGAMARSSRKTRAKGTRARKPTAGRRPVQGTLPFRQRGGARPGAGRKPKGQTAMVARSTRPAHAAYHPALVTVKLRQHLPRLRDRKERAALLTHFARGKDRFGFRLLHFAILNDHLHFVVEAKDRTALSRGLQGLLIRLARGLNKLWGRKGKVFADRYHDRALKSPREVRNALVYVLGNGRKHAAQGRMIAPFDGPDMFTSAPWFDGFVAAIEVRGIDGMPLPVARARTWLANDGWRRLGKIGLEEQPKVG